MMNITVDKTAKKMQKQSQKDIWRKRVIAVIGRYLEMMMDEKYMNGTKEERIDMIKSVACR